MALEMGLDFRFSSQKQTKGFNWSKKIQLKMNWILL